MSYKEGIIAAITELNDRTGSSMIAIKKHMQANLPADKKWMNATFLKALKNEVANGDLVQVKNSYKLSADYKKNKASVRVAYVFIFKLYHVTNTDTDMTCPCSACKSCPQEEGSSEEEDCPQEEGSSEEEDCPQEEGCSEEEGCECLDFIQPVSFFYSIQLNVFNLDIHCSTFLGHKEGGT